MDENSRQQKQQPYTTPAIIYELDLETRAGSPVGVEDFEGILPNSGFIKI